MSELDQNEITGRLERLEAENRRLARETRRFKRFGLAVVVCGAVAAIGAANLELPVLVGSALVIKDNEQNDRIFMGFNDTGAAQILVRDNQGKPHIQLVTTPNGEISAVNLFDIDGQLKANVFVNRENQGVTVNGQKIP